MASRSKDNSKMPGLRARVTTGNPCGSCFQFTLNEVKGHDISRAKSSRASAPEVLKRRRARSPSLPVGAAHVSPARKRWVRDI